MEFNTDHFRSFFAELAKNGYHIFSQKLAEQGGFYPNDFASVPDLDIGDLKPNDRITIRAFFAADNSTKPRVDSGYIDLEVEYVDRDCEKVFANILTVLPSAFALSKDSTIELELDEILFRQSV